MKKINYIFGLVVGLTTCTNAIALTAESDAKLWLLKADGFLVPADSKIIIQVQLYKNNKLKKTKLYEVYTKDPRSTLVLFRHKYERNQKVLMKQHDFWLFLPRSRRPIRISAQQKLLGDASAGDIVNLKFNDDYHGKLITCDAGQCKFELTRKHRGVSYSKAILTLRRSNGLALRADLYLNKNRIAKTAIYHYKLNGGKLRISKIEYQDKIRSNTHTIMLFKKIEAFTSPGKWFNPAFIARKKVLP